MRDANRVEHVAQRDATCGQVGLVVAHSDVMERLRTDHGHNDIARGDMQFVELTRRSDCGPQASETGAENDDIFHRRTLPTYISLLSPRSRGLNPPAGSGPRTPTRIRLARHSAIPGPI